ncbi:MAG: hypothetical protein ACRDH8_06955 [Actinomycetota bacterium]
MKKLPGLRGVVALAILGALVASVLISPAGAAKSLTRKKVKRIATKIVNNIAYTQAEADALFKDECPAGTARFGEGCMETAARTAAAWGVAATTCATAGRRLPAVDELDDYLSQPGVSTGAELTADIVKDGTSFLVVTTSGQGVIADSNFGPLPYRCFQSLNNL